MLSRFYYKPALKQHDFSSWIWTLGHKIGKISPILMYRSKLEIDGWWGDHFLRLSVKKSPFHYSVRPILIDMWAGPCLLPAAWAAGREIFSFPETQNLKHERRGGRWCGGAGRGWGDTWNTCNLCPGPQLSINSIYSLQIDISLLAALTISSHGQTTKNGTLNDLCSCFRSVILSASAAPTVTRQLCRL